MADNNQQDNNDQNNRGQVPGWRFPGPQSPWQFILSIVLIGVLVVYVVRGFTMDGGARAIDPLPTNDFVVAVKENRVKEVTYHVSAGELEGTYYLSKEDVGKEGKARRFTSNYVGEDSLQELMGQHPSIVFEIDTSSSELWETLIATILPTVIVIVALMYFMNQINGQNGRAMNFGRADNARTTEETRPKTKFADLPKTLPVRRDLALLVDSDVTYSDIKHVVEQSERKLLRGVNLFDVYEGKNLEAGKKSYAISIILQDDVKTLQDKQIDAVMNKIIANLEKQVGAKLR